MKLVLAYNSPQYGVLVTTLEAEDAEPTKGEVIDAILADKGATPEQAGEIYENYSQWASRVLECL